MSSELVVCRQWSLLRLTLRLFPIVLVAPSMVVVLLFHAKNQIGIANRFGLVRLVRGLRTFTECHVGRR